MKKALLPSLVLLGCLCSIGLGYGNIYSHNFSILDGANNQILRLSYNYSPLEFNSKATGSIFPGTFGNEILIQKMVMSDSEKGFYNLDFNDGCYVILKNGKYVGVKAEDIKNNKASGMLGEPNGLSQVIFRDKVEASLSGLAAISGRPANNTVKIDLAGKFNPRDVKALMLIYGTNGAGFQAFDINSWMKNSATNKDATSKEAACQIAYIPIKEIKRNNGEWLLVPDKDKTKVEYLGDGLIVAPIVPLLNLNSLKTMDSLAKKYSGSN